MSNRTIDVVLPQAVIELDRRRETLHECIRRFAEASAPELAGVFSRGIRGVFVLVAHLRRLAHCVTIVFRPWSISASSHSLKRLANAEVGQIPHFGVKCGSNSTRHGYPPLSTENDSISTILSGHSDDPNRTQVLRIATRKSPLALWQAYFVRDALEAAHPDLRVDLLTMSTRGDIILDTPLAKIGGKGLFVKELERALLDHEADIAVHSMKDVPMAFPAGLGLAVICEREDPTDAFVSNSHTSLAQLPKGAKVGTSSLRRQCQLRARRPDLEILDLRGNVGTRLGKLDAGEYDAIILASAGLIRLELEDRIAERLSPEDSLPAGGQGAVGIECRLDDEKTLARLSCLHHDDTAARVVAERAMNSTLNGGCQVPIACFAELDLADTNGGELTLRGLVGSADGSRLLRAEARGSALAAEALGIAVAEDLLSQGAAELLAELDPR